LLKLQVSIGSEQRQIVAGIGKYEPESLVGKTIIVVANLKPAKLMGTNRKGWSWLQAIAKFTASRQSWKKSIPAPK
jgi:methionine--tRNA ligase beta chain